MVCAVLLTGTLAGILPSFAGMWIAEMQFMYLLIGASAGWIALWLGVTLVFGRVYCSSVCPLGTLLDLGARLTRRNKPHRHSAPANILRYTIAGLTCVCIVVGIAVIPSVIDPESAYANIVGGLVRPLIHWWKELLGHPVARVATASGLGAIVGGVTLVLAGMSSTRGRLYCNTVCPAGAILSLVSRNAVVHIDIDTDLCTHCGKCEEACKASCINLKDCMTDMSRCINCFNCIDVCPDGAISYTSRRHTLSTPMMQKIKNQLRPSLPQPTLNIDSQSSHTSGKE